MNTSPYHFFGWYHRDSNRCLRYSSHGNMSKFNVKLTSFARRNFISLKSSKEETGKQKNFRIAFLKMGCPRFPSPLFCKPIFPPLSLALGRYLWTKKKGREKIWARSGPSPAKTIEEKKRREKEVLPLFRKKEWKAQARLFIKKSWIWNVLIPTVENEWIMKAERRLRKRKARRKQIEKDPSRQILSTLELILYELPPLLPFSNLRTSWYIGTDLCSVKN